MVQVNRAHLYLSEGSHQGNDFLYENGKETHHYQTTWEECGKVTLGVQQPS